MELIFCRNHDNQESYTTMVIKLSYQTLKSRRYLWIRLCFLLTMVLFMITYHISSKQRIAGAKGNFEVNFRFDTVNRSYLRRDKLPTLTLAQLKMLSGRENFSLSFVSKIIHQSWIDKNIPSRFQRWSYSWSNCLPDWRYKLWTDETNDLMVKTLFPWFYPSYMRLPQKIQKVDSVRYLYLFVDGGIYTDLDTECLRPLAPLISNHTIVFGAMKGRIDDRNILEIPEGYVQNSFMYSSPGHPFWLNVLETIMNRSDLSQVLITTGPAMLQEEIRRWRRGHPERRHELKIYPPMYLNPFSWITRDFDVCKDFNLMSNKDIKKCKAHYPESYVIQYHTQTWDRGKSYIDRDD